MRTFQSVLLLDNRALFFVIVLICLMAITELSIPQILFYTEDINTSVNGDIVIFSILFTISSFVQYLIIRYVRSKVRGRGNNSLEWMLWSVIGLQCMYATIIIIIIVK